MDVLSQKPYTYGKHFAPHDIAVRELSTGKSRLEAAKEVGIKFEITPNLPGDDGINAGRMFFERLWIDEETCALFLDSIAQYRREWDDSKGMFKKTPCVRRFRFMEITVMRLTLALCLLFSGCQIDVTHEVAIVKDYAERYEPQIRMVALEDVGEVPAPPGQFTDVPDAKILAAIEKLASAGSRAHEKYIILIFLRHHRANMEIARQSYELQDLFAKSHANPMVKELCRLIDCKPPDAEPMFSGVVYSWAKRHRERQQYEPIRVEMQRIEAVEKQIEENLKEPLNQDGTSNRS